MQRRIKLVYLAALFSGIAAVACNYESPLLPTSPVTTVPSASIIIPTDGTCGGSNTWWRWHQTFGCGQVRIYDNTGLGSTSAAGIAGLIGEWNATGLPAAGMFTLVTTGSPSDAFTIEKGAQDDPLNTTGWCGSTDLGSNVITVWRDSVGKPTCEGVASLSSILVHEFSHLAGGSTGHLDEYLSAGEVPAVAHCASTVVGPVSGQFCALEIYGLAYIYGLSSYSPVNVWDTFKAKHMMTQLQMTQSGTPIDLGETISIKLGDSVSLGTTYKFERSSASELDETPHTSDNRSWDASGAVSLSGSGFTSRMLHANSVGSGVVWVKLNSLYNSRYLIGPTADSVAYAVTVYQPSLSLGASHFLANAVVSGSAPSGSTSVTMSGTGGSSQAWSASKTASWATLTGSSGTGSGTVSWSRSTSGLSAGTYTGTITVTAPGAANSPIVIYDTLVVGSASPPPTPTGFQLSTTVCSEIPYNQKWYAEYGVDWGASATPNVADSFHIYEVYGGVWSSRALAAKGLAGSYTSVVGDWDYNMYLITPVADWRHFWIQFFNGAGTSDSVRIAGDSVLTSAGCTL